MRDVHCHILPGVDDGARDMLESMAMFRAAKAAGVTGMVCTPHCRDPYFDFEAMWGAFRDFSEQVHAVDPGFPLTMGFEVSHRKLMELGLAWAPRLCFAGGNEILLEFTPSALPSRFSEYERTVFYLQGMGLHVIVAHPERCWAIRENPELAEELVRMGCDLQVSSDFMRGSRFGWSRRLATSLIKSGLVSHIASDAHQAEDYAVLARSMRRWSGLVGGTDRSRALAGDRAGLVRCVPGRL